MITVCFGFWDNIFLSPNKLWYNILKKKWYVWNSVSLLFKETWSGPIIGIKFNTCSGTPELMPFLILSVIALLIFTCPGQSAITGMIKLFK